MSIIILAATLSRYPCCVVKGYNSSAPRRKNVGLWQIYARYMNIFVLKSMSHRRTFSNMQTHSRNRQYYQHNKSYISTMSVSPVQNKKLAKMTVCKYQKKQDKPADIIIFEQFERLLIVNRLTTRNSCIFDQESVKIMKKSVMS